MSSTVIEIGVTIPALVSLVAVKADRYGVSTLHQLGGRVARRGGTGYFFIYLPDKLQLETMARLQLLEEFRDGFSHAEHNCELRGYGDLTKEGDWLHRTLRCSLCIRIELLPADIHQIAGEPTCASAPRNESGLKGYPCLEFGMYKAPMRGAQCVGGN